VNRRQRAALYHAGYLSFEALDPMFRHRAGRLTVVLTVQAGYE